ncbi:PLAC8 family-domain-containing protein [Gloeopeniophorella convolvens]|nr:PLAC8 family-domain-containing protein [Gloeopeniophorella convolvens]
MSERSAPPPFVASEPAPGYKMSATPSDVNPSIPESQATVPVEPTAPRSVVVGEQPRPKLSMASALEPNNAVAPGGGGDRNAQRVPIMGDGLRTWSFGLLDCFADLPTCVMSLCCPCIAYARNRHRFEHLERHGTPLRQEVEVYNQDCLAHLILGVINAGWGLQAISRSEVRQRYGIRGDAFNDVLSSVFCLSCELVQEHREIELEELSFPRQQ